MELVLAMDLRQNLVVHGKSGERETYKPLNWGCSPTAEPLGFVRSIDPEFLYIADLDRIEGTGSHDAIIRECSQLVTRCYVDRGCRSPEDLLTGDNIVNVVGTETGGDDLSGYHGGFLSVDVKAGKVIPSGRDPVEIIRSAGNLDFDGCILLNVSAVGTKTGIDLDLLTSLRESYDGRLFYGGGVASPQDLMNINSAGFDGTIIATALHYGAVPLSWIRRGSCC
jgi:phosphoribosylformimino-5-aminoimidazole carboxamide ribotide isomerase